MVPSVEASRKRDIDSRDLLDDHGISSNSTSERSRHATVIIDVSRITHVESWTVEAGGPLHKRARIVSPPCAASHDDVQVEHNPDVISLGDVPLPIRPEDITRRLQNSGYEAPDHIRIDREHIPVSVTEGPSSAAPGQVHSINLDQPLLHFYHKTFVPSFPPGDYHEDLIPVDPVKKCSNDFFDKSSSAKVHVVEMSNEEAYKQWHLADEESEEYPSGEETEESYESVTDYEDGGWEGWDDDDGPIMGMEFNPFDGHRCDHNESFDDIEDTPRTTIRNGGTMDDDDIAAGVFEYDLDDERYVEPPMPPVEVIDGWIQEERESRREERRNRREYEMEERRRKWKQEREKKAKAMEKMRGEILERDKEGELLKDYRIVVGEVEVGLRRTIRVPDNELSKQTRLLPLDLGSFRIFNVADYANRLPNQVVERGGAFISMHKREAMSLTFSHVPSGNACSFLDKYFDRTVHVAVSAGEVDAIVGETGGGGVTGQKNYIPVKEEGECLWLHGVNTRTHGVVKQFGLTSRCANVNEENLGNEQDVDGLQITIFRRFPELVHFFLQILDGGTSPANIASPDVGTTRKKLDLYSTPRQLGLKEGDVIYMEDLGAPKHVWLRSSSEPPKADFRGPKLRMKAFDKSGDGFHVWVASNTQTNPKILQRIDCSPETKIDDVDEKTGDELGCILASRVYSLCKKEHGDLDSFKTLSDYGCKSGDALAIIDFPLDNHFYPAMIRSNSSGIIGIDKLPVSAYDPEPIAQLNISILSSSIFKMATGRPPPATPVNAMVFKTLGIQWPEDDSTSGSNSSSSPGCLMQGLTQGADADNLEERSSTTHRLAGSDILVSSRGKQKHPVLRNGSAGLV